MSEESLLRYRVGNHLGRTVYRDGAFIGIFDFADDAETVVNLLNGHESMRRVLHAIEQMGTKIMAAIDNLTAADSGLATAEAGVATNVAALVTEQATFLTDVAARLANAPDPAQVQAVADDLNTKAADLNAQAAQIAQLASDQAANDPGATPAA